MEPNHSYVLEMCRQTFPGGRILDFGCGRGEVVVAGRAAGLDIVGVDSYQTAEYRQVVQQMGLLDDHIRELENGVIPFRGESFDIVISNMVFEHAEDIESVLREISRVLRKGGVLLTLFPGKEVVQEPHVGIPMVHWFPKKSRLRRMYTYALRTLGFGAKPGKPRAQWVDDSLFFIDNFTFYRTREEFDGALERWGFEQKDIEDDYIRFRLALIGLQRWARMTNHPIINAPLRVFCRRYGTRVIMATRAS